MNTEDPTKNYRTTLYMREIPRNHWSLYAEKGHVVSGPHLFKNVLEAVEWGKSFISSWIGWEIILCISKDRKGIHGTHFKSIKTHQGPKIRME